MTDKEPLYHIENPIFWDNDELDELSARIIQKELRKKNSQKIPSVLSSESIRNAIESETGLISLVTIDGSIGRVALFDDGISGIKGIKLEIEKKLQKLDAEKAKKSSSA